MRHPDDPALESKVAPGMPLQVLCYERADDIAAGVSGVVTRGKGIRADFPELNPAEIPMAAAGDGGAGALSARPDRRQPPLARAARGRCPAARAGRWGCGWSTTRWSCRRRRVPAKHGGLVMSIGQFNQWVGGQLMASGLVQIWPGTPVSAPMFAGKAVKGVRLARPGSGSRGCSG